MSDLAARIPEDIKTAMKAKDAVSLNALRALKTAMSNTSIEKGHLTAPLDDAEVAALIRKQIKQRQDSYEQFSKAGREELAATEKAEIAALVDAVVTETGAASKADMGKVMKLAQERAAGRADGKSLSQEVAKRLA